MSGTYTETTRWQSPLRNLGGESFLLPAFSLNSYRVQSRLTRRCSPRCSSSTPPLLLQKPLPRTLQAATHS